MYSGICRKIGSRQHNELKREKNPISNVCKTLILAFEANSALSRENETKIVKITHSESSPENTIVSPCAEWFNNTSTAIFRNFCYSNGTQRRTFTSSQITKTNYSGRKSSTNAKAQRSFFNVAAIECIRAIHTNEILDLKLSVLHS